MEKTFGSTCHGAGRVLSRKAAKKASKGRAIHRELEDKGILVRWTGRSTLAEEMPDAYKDVSEVVNVVHGAGISRKVFRIGYIQFGGKCTDYGEDGKHKNVPQAADHNPGHRYPAILGNIQRHNRR